MIDRRRPRGRPVSADWRQASSATNSHWRARPNASSPSSSASPSSLRNASLAARVWPTAARVGRVCTSGLARARAHAPHPPPSVLSAPPLASSGVELLARRTKSDSAPGALPAKRPRAAALSAARVTCERKSLAEVRSLLSHLHERRGRLSRLTARRSLPGSAKLGGRDGGGGESARKCSSVQPERTLPAPGLAAQIELAS